MIGQKDKRFGDFLRKIIEASKYNCYYCSDTINLGELLEIDEKLKRMNPENHEFLLDNLPNSNNSRKSPFIHECDLEYDVLNICKECFKKARNE